jgi:ankyrin repeat protein
VTLLKIAFSNGKLNFAEFLFRKGANINSINDKNGQTLLIDAVIQNRLDHVK